MSVDHLEEIRQLYFKTTRATIDRDFDRAIDLLKEMPEEQRAPRDGFRKVLHMLRDQEQPQDPEATPFLWPFLRNSGGERTASGTFRSMASI